MKQKDLITLVGAIFLGLLLSIGASKLIFATPANTQEQVPVVPAISSNFSTPSKQFFNDQSIDPTQLIQIGNNSNPTPFNSVNQ
jgi:hypothetical protein